MKNNSFKNKPCCESFMSRYLNEENRLQAIKEAENCTGCMQQAVLFEMTLVTSRKKLVATLADLALSEQKILSMVEIFLRESDKNSPVFSGADWVTLWSNKADLNLFQDIVLALRSGQSDLLETPAYLKTILRNRAQNPVVGQKDGIIIRMKEKLHLVGSLLQDVLVIPQEREAFAVRSAAAVADAGLLQFVTTEAGENKILYQVVKDGKETVMLTVRLQQFRPLPRMMKIKRDGRLISSFQLKEDFAYFPKLQPGDYVIELSDQIGKTLKQVEISLVNE